MDANSPVFQKIYTLTLIHKFPVQMTCWIFPGTSIDLNFAGRSGALCGMCKSPNASTSTIPPIYTYKTHTCQYLLTKLIPHPPNTCSSHIINHLIKAIRSVRLIYMRKSLTCTFYPINACIIKNSFELIAFYYNL